MFLMLVVARFVRVQGRVTVFLAFPWRPLLAKTTLRSFLQRAVRRRDGRPRTAMAGMSEGQAGYIGNMRGSNDDPEKELFEILWRQRRLLPPYSNRVHGRRLRKWSYWLMLFVLYEAIWIPMQLVFYSRDPSYDYRIPVPQVIVQYLIDIAFAVDIFVRFRTLYISGAEEGNELVTDLSKISRRYLRSSFTLDLVACLPSELPPQPCARTADNATRGTARPHAPAVSPSPHPLAHSMC